MTSPERAIGRSLPRNEDPAFLTGRARYGGDLLEGDERRGYAVFVRSPLAHGTVLDVDVTAAAEAPGVLGAFSADHLDVFPAGRFAPAIHSVFAQPLLAEKRVRYVGEPVAVVVATSPETAVDASELVEVTYDPLPPVIDLDDALAGTTLLFPPGTEARLGPTAPADDEHTGGNVAIDIPRTGSPEVSPSPFDTADVVVRQRIMNPRMTPAPLEPRVVTCSWPAEGSLTVWASTQRPHGHRDELCRLYGLDTDDVVVIAPEVGGGFGGKNSRTPEERLIPFLARRLQRTVTWIETRSENLAAATQGRGERFDFTLAGSSEGRIEGLKVEMVKDCGAYPITGAILPAGYTVPMASGPYDIAHVEFSARCVATTQPPTSAYRGAGRGPYLAGLERVVDLFADEIGMDPAEVRRRNLVAPHQMPYRSPTGAVYDEADYPADLERALAIVDYPARRAEQAGRRAEGGPLQLGVGIACYNHLTVGGGGEEASVTILDDGGALVVTGTSSQGHGHAITWAQIASDVLGIAVDRIEVIEGRTDLIATGVGAVGSRSLQTAGIAVHRAASAVVDRARTLAADRLEAAPGDVVLDRARGSFHVIGTPARAVTWKELAAQGPGPADPSSGPAELSCGDLYDNEGRNTYPSGTHVAVVEVDTETGKVSIVRFVAVDDAGVRVNPMIVEGQLHGGIAAGISQALGEMVHYDPDGNLRTPTFVEYQIATADELPSFEVAAAEVATSFNELGFKGVGESGTIGATPAVHNAVVDALSPLGVLHVDLPCTAERVWRAVRAATDFESGGERR